MVPVTWDGLPPVWQDIFAHLDPVMVSLCKEGFITAEELDSITAQEHVKDLDDMIDCFEKSKAKREFGLSLVEVVKVCPESPFHSLAEQDFTQYAQLVIHQAMAVFGAAFAAKLDPGRNRNDTNKFLEEVRERAIKSVVDAGKELNTNLRSAILMFTKQ